MFHYSIYVMLTWLSFYYNSMGRRIVFLYYLCFSFLLDTLRLFIIEEAGDLYKRSGDGTVSSALKESEQCHLILKVVNV